ncbi:STAS domain-containing protein [Roseomonas marmotae]|uniref:Anti-sigma factor antagonist n=1 Tax=Roseomonas marmotae TaxID=2768161 RepID=A0ABS3K753_9PROT|nr:STAS domain-containing protein [Roseomonas marmotae]MBO1073300.1 STAS domain-containing protein [Roseomonas marmotae]QTI79082.1 STAS domain-containing protein [Roseomonas marmotae]
MQVMDSGVEGLRLAALEGRLDTATAPQIEQAVLPLMDGKGLVLDMSAVRFVSSAGLRVLLKLAKAAKSGKRGFAVCGLQPTVQEVFEIGGFLQIIPIFPSRGEAISALG